MNPLLRPHLKQRLTNREEYFGFFFALAICDVLAIHFYFVKIADLRGLLRGFSRIRICVNLRFNLRQSAK